MTTTTTTTYRWVSGRDDYGRSIHHLYDNTHRVHGVVVKHPLRRKGETGAYWYTRWYMPQGTPREEDVREFTTLADAKAGLLATVAA